MAFLRQAMYRGDPGLFSGLKKLVGGAIKAVLPGPLRTALNIGGGLIRSLGRRGMRTPMSTVAPRAMQTTNDAEGQAAFMQLISQRRGGRGRSSRRRFGSLRYRRMGPGCAGDPGPLDWIKSQIGGGAVGSLAQRAGEWARRNPGLAASIAGAGGTIFGSLAGAGIAGRLAGPGASGLVRGMTGADDMGGRRYRRIQYTNMRALNRSIRRVQGFAKLARKALRITHSVRRPARSRTFTARKKR